MPHTESAKKRHRQTINRTLANRVLRGHVRSTERQLRELVAQGDKKGAAALLPKAFQSLDKAAKKRVLHPNTASNHKAKLSRLVK